jgi:hypothetical protein
VGGTIVHRFVGSESEGYVLGPTGEQLVFQSVLYIKQDWSCFVGINSDLSELEGARTVKVIGTYGGIQVDTASSSTDRPILIAHHIDVPDRQRATAKMICRRVEFLAESQRRERK